MLFVHDVSLLSIESFHGAPHLVDVDGKRENYCAHK